MKNFMQRVPPAAARLKNVSFFVIFIDYALITFAKLAT